jgi:putative Mn2+ efflux pump MntP
MAKKARKKLEEDAEPAFEFPEFDAPGFLWKEYELLSATALAGVIALLLGVMGWAFVSVYPNAWPPLGVGLIGLVGSVFLIQRLRPKSSAYTKGDWAGLIALEFFGWMAVWFLLLNVLPGGL